MSSIHREAAQGFQAGAETYVKGRPDYPPEVAEWLRRDLGLEAGKTALDLGSGTGKFLPRLIATGATVIAVEPVAAMLAQLIAHNPNIVAKKGDAENIPLADNAIDAVVCAQSFHWFSTRAALAEIRRVLKPGGVFGLIWNVRDESVGWVSRLTEIMKPYEGDTPRYTSQLWRNVFPADGFGPLHNKHFRNGHVGAPEHVIVDRVLSTSFIAALPNPEQEAVATQVRQLIAATPELAAKGQVIFPYETAAFSCAKLG